MKSNYLLSIVISVVTLVVVVLFFSQEKNTAIVNQYKAEKAPDTTRVISENAKSTILVESEKHGVTSSSDSLKQVNSTESTTVADEGDPYADAAVKAQLMQVADQYAEAIRYPATSQPIADEEELQQYLPNRSAAVGFPFPVDGQDNPIELELKTSKFQYFSGEPIPIALSIKGAPSDASIDVEGVLTTLEGERLMDLRLPEGDGSRDFYAEFLPGEAATSSWPLELQVRVYVSVDEHRLFVSAPLRYAMPSARLQGVEFSSVEKEYLRIPLVFQVEKSGYYFVAANLYSQNSGKALLHIESEGRMAEGLDRMTMKAHAEALKVSADEGPYLLKDFSIVRTADENDEHDQAGNSTQVYYIVEGFPFSDYDDTPYQDPLAEERLAFLRELGQL